MTLTRRGPKLADLHRDYWIAVRPWRKRGTRIAPEDIFEARLALCRACPMHYWTEDPDGYGRCADVRRSCSVVRLWRAETICGLPAGARQW